ncbi:TPA: hypothetical protein ACS3GE_002942 [Legionella pneumophila]|uniref:hypothetical protein n=1 Tax=Legionella pneumophila TaxID=446 RepID=UPI0035A950DE
MDLYLKTQRCRYHRGNREVKKRILDEFCETHGYHRKAAARLLRQSRIPQTICYCCFATTDSLRWLGLLTQAKYLLITLNF